MQTGSEVSVASGILHFQALYMRTLNGKLALNEYGLPTGFWATDRIVSTLRTEDEEPPEDAWIQLDYNEGFPTVGRNEIGRAHV